MLKSDQTPILPKNQPEERPLFFSLMIMAFLAGVTLLGVLFALRFSQLWQTELAKTATVQVFTPGKNNTLSDDEKLQAQAVEILRGVDSLKNVEPLSREDSRALLRPWLGDAQLPDDLPLPILIHIVKQSGTPFDIALIKQRFLDANIEAEIDDHQQWRTSFTRSWTQLNLILGGLLFIILLASAAITSYATQSVLRARRDIILVLQQVGTRECYISGLFVWRFLALALKAAFVGIGLTLILALIFLLGQNLNPVSDNISFDLKFTDIMFLGLLAMIIGFISALTAGYMSLRLLKHSGLD